MKPLALSFLAGLVSALGFAAARPLAADPLRFRRLGSGWSTTRRGLRSRARPRLVVRRRPVRARPQLDRHRLHLPGGDAGLARLGRGRPAVALPRRLPGRRGRASPGAGAEGNRARLRPRFSPPPGSSPNGFAPPCSPASPGTRSGVALLDSGLAGPALDRHLRPVRPRRPVRRALFLLALKRPPATAPAASAR